MQTQKALGFLLACFLLAGCGGVGPAPVVGEGGYAGPAPGVDRAAAQRERLADAMEREWQEQTRELARAEARRAAAAARVPALWAPLDQTVKALAQEFNGRFSVVAVDLTSGARYEYRPQDRYLPASTFKLPVCLCVLEAIDRGELSWDTLVTFTPPDDDTVGQGGFATTAYGTKWPVRNLFDRSIISSNNVAVKMLARTLTWDGLKACTSQIGGMVTRTAEGSTAVSAPDEAAWWLHLWQMKQARPTLAEEIMRPLRAVTYRGRIQAGTPEPDLVTHKFGTYPPYENDGAIVWGERPYILVVMTATPDHVGVDWTFMRIARAAWDAVYAAS